MYVEIFSLNLVAILLMSLLFLYIAMTLIFSIFSCILDNSQTSVTFFNNQSLSSISKQINIIIVPQIVNEDTFSRILSSACFIASLNYLSEYAFTRSSYTTLCRTPCRAHSAAVPSLTFGDSKNWRYVKDPYHLD